MSVLTTASDVITLLQKKIERANRALTRAENRMTSPSNSPLDLADHAIRLATVQATVEALQDFHHDLTGETYSEPKSEV